MKTDWRDGNQVGLLVNGDTFFPRVFASIRNAQSDIVLETFIIEEDEIGAELRKELIAAARRGVIVNVTVDGYGTWNLSDDYIDGLIDAGVRLHIFDPQPKLWGVRLNVFRRLHRKLIVIDQRLAFVGGINFCIDHVIRSGPKAKQDYAVEITGPVVSDIYRTCQLLLLQTPNKEDPHHVDSIEGTTEWAATGATRVLLVKRDNDHHRTDIERQYLLAARLAQEKLVIANAYFFPGYRLLRELRRAARRKVEVILILQGQPDMAWVSALSRLLYEYLLRSGIKIYEYRKRPLHGKVAIMDNKWATVGSSNLDPLSLSLNLEANVIIEDEAFNHQLYQNLTTIIEQDCEQFTLQTAARGYWWRMPLIFLSFHFLRKFPRLLNWLPAHTHKLELLTPAQKTSDDSLKSTALSEKAPPIDNDETRNENAPV